MVKPKKKIHIYSKPELWLYLVLVSLAFGNYVGWSTIFKEVKYFCSLQGEGFYSLTSFSGTITKNPIITPCFWGSIGFAIAFVWTVTILAKKGKSRASGLRTLLYLLVGGTLFALVNNLPVFYKYFTQPGSQLGCTADKVSSPFLTSCFLGFLAFLLATIFALLSYRLMDSRRK